MADCSVGLALSALLTLVTFIAAHTYERPKPETRQPHHASMNGSNNFANAASPLKHTRPMHQVTPTAFTRQILTLPDNAMG